MQKGQQYEDMHPDERSSRGTQTGKKAQTKNHAPGEQRSFPDR
jgi:hypothetical protein